MSDQKLFAGHAVRRIRRASGLTQSAMAEALGVSPSYLNLIERNQRPLTAALMLRLADRFDFDPRTLSGAAPGGGVEAIRRRLADPLFADLGLDRAAVADWISLAPEAAEAFARAFDRMGQGGVPMGDPITAVRQEIERWRNHFPDLDSQAEALADDLRLGSGDLYGAIAERLRVKHQLSIRILPVDVMPDRLRRLDLHSRQVQLSELLDPASRTFAAAFQLAQLEARAEIEALVSGAAFAERAGERLYRRHLTSYFAAALMMPYARFLRACETTGYDLELLQRRFGAGFEQIAHRLTTLQRVGARGLPFFMLRIDRQSAMPAPALRLWWTAICAALCGMCTAPLTGRAASRVKSWCWKMAAAGSLWRGRCVPMRQAPGPWTPNLWSVWGWRQSLQHHLLLHEGLIFRPDQPRRLALAVANVCAQNVRSAAPRRLGVS